MSIKKQYIPAPLASAVKGGYVTDASELLDKNKGKRQDVINQETDSQISGIKGGSTKSIAQLDSQINGNGGIDDRLGTVEQLAEISIGGGDAQIATGADFDNPTAEQRAKVPTVGAVLDGADDEPVAGSNNLVKSEGVAKSVRNVEHKAVPVNIPFSENNLKQGYYKNNGQMSSSTTSRCYNFLFDNTILKTIKIVNVDAPQLIVKLFNSEGTLVSQKAINTNSSYEWTDLSTFNRVALSWVENISNIFNYNVYLSALSQQTTNLNYTLNREKFYSGDLNKGYIAGGFTAPNEQGEIYFYPIITETYYRKAIIFPIADSKSIVFSGHLKVVNMGKIKEVVANSSDLRYKIDTSISYSKYYSLEFNETANTTTLLIQKEMCPCVITMGADDNSKFVSEIVSATLNTSMFTDADLYELTNTIVGNPAANFTNTNYTVMDSNGVVSVKKSNNPYYWRKAPLIPMNAGDIVVTGFIQLTNYYKVIGLGEKFYEYKVENGSSQSYAIDYDEDRDISTIHLYGDFPVVFSIANGYDRSQRLQCEILSYTPINTNGKNFSALVPYINPCEFDADIISYWEPTMIVTNNGTIVIGAVCGDINGIDRTFNSYSTDKGATWHTNYVDGHRYLAYDRVNNVLFSLDGRSLFKSLDYGMTWEEVIFIGVDGVPTYDHEEILDEFDRLRDEEKAAYEEDPTIQRYAYVHYHSGSPNPGIQLSNGVICFQRREGIKKYKAVKQDGEWVVDENGYIDTSNPNAYDTSFDSTRIPCSVAYITYSKDYGDSWESSGITPIDVMMDELAIVEAAPNQICINGRGGSEAAWEAEVVKRHIFFQNTPVADRAQFAIDSWVADYETRYTNDIEDSIVNAGICKVSNFKLTGSTADPISFWLFCNVYNPNRFERHSLMLRISPDCHNWFKVDHLVSEQGYMVGGYVSIASYGENIYLVMEDKRKNKPLRFINLTKTHLEGILKTYYLSKTLF